METPPSSRRFWLVIAAGLLIGAALALVVFAGLPGTNIEAGGATPAPVAGSPAPDFTLQTVDGRTLSLSDTRGSPTLINFWATWCIPCRIEMPFLQSRYERFHDAKGLRVLAVDFDEPQTDVAAFVEGLGLTFDVLLDPGGKVQELYRLRGYPTSFFLDGEGIITAVQIGVMSESKLDGYLDGIGVNDE